MFVGVVKVFIVEVEGVFFWVFFDWMSLFGCCRCPSYSYICTQQKDFGRLEECRQMGEFMLCVVNGY